MPKRSDSGSTITEMIAVLFDVANTGMRLLKMGDLAERVLREMIEDCSKIEILS
jgi:hypothetical protein